MTAHRSTQQGSASLELAVAAPVMVLFLLFAVLAGRLAQAQEDVENAAWGAARAASTHHDPGAARSDAVATARQVLLGRRVTCRRLDVSVDTSALVAGGQVRTEVTCIVGLADLSLLAVPGTRAVRARAAEVVDRFRGD